MRSRSVGTIPGPSSSTSTRTSFADESMVIRTSPAASAMLDRVVDHVDQHERETVVVDRDAERRERYRPLERHRAVRGGRLARIEGRGERTIEPGTCARGKSRVQIEEPDERVR
jgi:hypothetical protein